MGGKKDKKPEAVDMDTALSKMLRDALAGGSSQPTPKYNKSVESFASYLDRLSLHFDQLPHLSDSEKSSRLCLALDADLFSTLRDSVQPKAVRDLTYKECVTALSNICDPPACVIAERYVFNSTNRQPGETVSDYIAKLKGLVRSCKFGNFRDQALRDRLVCGIANEHMTRKLLGEEEDLTFDEASKMVLDMERTTKSAAHISGQGSSSSSVLASRVAAASHSPSRFSRHSPAKSRSPSVSPSRSSRHVKFATDQGAQKSSSESKPTPTANKSFEPRLCVRCYREHPPSSCPAQNWKCFSCDSVGHTAPCCPKRQVSVVSEVLNVSDSFCVPAMYVSIIVNGDVNVKFLVDTGSPVTLLF